jgi:hypothetical protein
MEFYMDLGDLGHHDAVVTGVVSRDEWGYKAYVKTITVPGVTERNVVSIVSERTLLEIEQRMIDQSILIEERGKCEPEDWDREGA